MRETLHEKKGDEDQVRCSDVVGVKSKKMTHAVVVDVGDDEHVDKELQQHDKQVLDHQMTCCSLLLRRREYWVDYPQV